MWLYDAVKDGAKILKEAWKIEEYQKILELLDDSYAQREKISILQAEVLELKDKLKVRDEYEFKNNCYYHKETWDGPFCSRCLDKDRQLLRMTISPGSDYANCPECKTHVDYSWKIPDQSVYYGREHSGNFW